MFNKMSTLVIFSSVVLTAHVLEYEGETPSSFGRQVATEYNWLARSKHGWIVDQVPRSIATYG